MVLSLWIGFLIVWMVVVGFGFGFGSGRRRGGVGGEGLGMRGVCGGFRGGERGRWNALGG